MTHMCRYRVPTYRRQSHRRPLVDTQACVAPISRCERRAPLSCVHSDRPYAHTTRSCAPRKRRRVYGTLGQAAWKTSCECKPTIVQIPHSAVLFLLISSPTKENASPPPPLLIKSKAASPPPPPGWPGGLGPPGYPIMGLPTGGAMPPRPCPGPFMMTCCCCMIVCCIIAICCCIAINCEKMQRAHGGSTGGGG